MWKPMGDSTGQCCTSLESTGHHIMRYPKRWPPPKAAATFLGGRPKAAPYYMVTCGFQGGVAYIFVNLRITVLILVIPCFRPHILDPIN